jgi:hypothetical protein
MNTRIANSKWQSHFDSGIANLDCCRLFPSLHSINLLSIAASNTAQEKKTHPSEIFRFTCSRVLSIQQATENASPHLTRATSPSVDLKILNYNT